MTNFEMLAKKSKNEQERIIKKMWGIDAIRLLAWLQEDFVEERLKPCPFCGKPQAKVVERENPDKEISISTYYCVRCEYCGIQTVSVSSRESAIEAWNERVGE